MKLHTPRRVSRDNEKRSRFTRADAVTWLTVYIIFLFGVPSRLVVGPLGSAGAVSMLLGLASMGIWLLLRVGAASKRFGPQPEPLGVALGLFLFSVGVSYALAMSGPINSDEVSPADVAILSLLSWTGTLLIARDGISRRERLDNFVWRMAVAGGLLGALGVAQFVTRMSIIDWIRIPGLTVVYETGVYYRDGRIRPSGTAIHPIEYGTILGLLLPLTLHVAFHHRTRPFIVRWLPALAVGGVIAISSSRSAYLSAVIGVLICMVAWTRKQRYAVIGLTVSGILVLMVIIPRLITSITNLFLGVSDDPSIESRTDSFSVAWAFLTQHPFFGRGLGTFLPKYRIFDNQYLLLLVSIGVVGTILFIGIFIVAVTQLIRAHRKAEDQATRDLSASLVGAIAAGVASLAFFDAFAFPMTMGAFFLVLGISGALSRQVLDMHDHVITLPLEEAFPVVAEPKRVRLDRSTGGEELPRRSITGGARRGRRAGVARPRIQ